MDREDVVVTAAFVMVMFVSGLAIGSRATSNVWREEAINRGVAEYNQSSGEWQWKPEFKEKHGEQGTK